MRVILKPHLLIRLKQRFILRSYPRKIILQSESNFFDIQTGHKIAIKTLKYGEKLRPLIVAYDIISEEIQVFTVYPSDNQEIQNKISRGRWVKDEKE